MKKSMHWGLGLTALLGLMSCYNNSSPRPGGPKDGTSVLAQVPGIDQKLAEKNDLSYHLMCASSAEQKLSIEQNLVATVVVPRGAAARQGTQIAFAPLPGKSISDSDTCAIDVVGSGKYEGESFSFSARPDLFYATTKAPLRSRKLAVDIYRLFRRPVELTKLVNIELVIRADPGAYTVTLACGNKVFTPAIIDSVAGSSYPVSFSIPLSELSTPAQCTEVRAEHRDKDLKLSAAFSAEVNSAWDETKRPRLELDLKIPVGGVATVISEGQCAEIDVDQRSCKALPESVAALGKAALATQPENDELLSCTAQASSKALVFGESISVIRTKASPAVYKLLFRKNGVLQEQEIPAELISTGNKSMEFYSLPADLAAAKGHFLLSYLGATSKPVLSIGVEWQQVDKPGVRLAAPKYWLAETCRLSSSIAPETWK